MNDDHLDHLFGAARQAKPDTSRAEFGFETRLLARLRAEREQTAPWFAWMWRLVPVFAAVVLALGIWNYVALDADTADWHGVITAGQENVTQLAPFGD
jgi:hypothetical protein